MKIAICDDIQFHAEELKNLISNYYDKNILFSIFINGDQLVEHCQNRNISFDAVFLDLLMPGLNGYETAKMLRLTDSEVPIIFVTSSEAYAIHGYDVDAISYLIKPVSQKKINSVFEKIEKHRSSLQIKYINVVDDGMVLRIPLRTITYFEKTGRKTAIHRLNEKTIVSRQSISEFSKCVENETHFIVCYQSNIVNLNLAVSIDQHKRKIFMSNGIEIDISREKMKFVMDSFMNLLGEY